MDMRKTETPRGVRHHRAIMESHRLDSFVTRREGEAVRHYTCARPGK